MGTMESDDGRVLCDQSGVEMEPMTPVTFHKIIEESVKDHNNDYMEAVLAFCEIHGKDPDDVVYLMSRPLVEKIRQSAIENGFFKREATLPL